MWGRPPGLRQQWQDVAGRKGGAKFGEVDVERTAQRRQIRAAGREDALTVRIVGERVEQVLKREIRVPSRDGFAERDMEHDFER